jgi:hypothetical protein
MRALGQRLRADLQIGLSVQDQLVHEAVIEYQVKYQGLSPPARRELRKDTVSKIASMMATLVNDGSLK